MAKFSFNILKKISGKSLFSFAFIIVTSFLQPTQAWMAFAPAWQNKYLKLLPGQMGGPGSKNGAGAMASFNSPSSVAIDASGNVYVADQYNHIIRKITAAGVVTTLAGQEGIIGATNGTGTAATFNFPAGVAVDASGNVYVADSRNNLIRKITSVGVVTTLAGQKGIIGATNGTGTAATFNFPAGVAVDASGNVYVADFSNSLIRKVTSAGGVTTLAGQKGIIGATNGTGTAASFNYPAGVAVDASGNVYVADQGNNLIRKVTTAGVVTTLAGRAGIFGSTNGTGTAATFSFPAGVAVDASGNVYVADQGNNLIRKVTSAGVMTTLAGQAGISGAANGLGTAASFSNPTGVAVDASGNVYVADFSNSLIRKITYAGVVTTLSGQAPTFFYPYGIAADASGNVYVADRGNNLIRKITSAGVVTTLAGQAGISGAANGLGTAASFSNPTGVAVDAAGNVYVADSSVSLIRKITAAGVVTTLAGQAGISGSTNGTGTAATFNYPTGVAVDASGNVYIADWYNNLIRKVTSAGVVTTLAGQAGIFGSTNGTGTAATFNFPAGVAVDASGNVYVADSRNNLIRKITSVGVVTTLAGQAGISGAANGPGTAASFNYPAGVAVDASGNVYVADFSNSLIRKITPDGFVSTILGVAGKTGVVLGRIPSTISSPDGIAVEGKNIILISDKKILKFPKP